MGLLDEAIRDHLELKRRRGADPTEIARAEREALDPVLPAGDAQDADAEPNAGEPTMPVEHSPHGQRPDGAHDAAFSPLGQETAELDVEAYMQAEAHSPGDEEEPLEWEQPGAHAAEPPPEPIPGQERLSID